MERLARSVRHASRRLRREPVFTAVAVLTLALGVGANTAIFGAVRDLLLRPPPYPDAGRLAVVERVVASPDAPPDTMPWWSYPKFRLLRDADPLLEVAAWVPVDLNLTDGDAAERVTAELVSPAYFRVLGVRPAAGRTFSAQEAAPGAPAVAVLGHGLWQRRFGADPGVVGRTVRLDRSPVRVVGVAPPGFSGLSTAAEVWLPLSRAESFAFEGALTDPGSHWFYAAARLRDDVPWPRARESTAAAAAGISEAYPGEAGTRERIALVPLARAGIEPSVRRATLLLFGAAGLVLLLAAVNLANLQLARGTGRVRELAIRRSVGAGRARLVGELMTESLLLALAGAAGGALVAVWGTELLSGLGHAVAARTVQSPVGRYTTATFQGLELDAGMLVFGLAVSLAAAVLFGLWPAMRATRTAPGAALAGGRRVGEGGSAFRARRALVAAEVALAVVLVAAAGLTARSLGSLRGVEAGVRLEGLLTFRTIPVSGPGETLDAPRFYDRLLAELEALPGVESAGVAQCLPLSGRCSRSVLVRADDRRWDVEAGPRTGAHYVSRGYFETLGIPRLGGRTFAGRDRTGGEKVAVVNEAFARRFFGGPEGAVGRRITVAVGFFDWRGSPETARIVGTVGNALYERPHEVVGGSAEPLPEVYLPVSQYDRVAATYFVVAPRGGASAAELVPAVRRAVAAVDPGLPVFDVRTMAERAAELLSSARMLALLLGAFGVLSLVLAAGGVFGVLAYLVRARRREIGIRMALGARSADILALVVSEGFGAAAVGLVVGTGALLALRGVFAGLLYDVSATDPATLIGVAGMLAGASLLAAVVPARRAIRVEPATTLREE